MFDSQIQKIGDAALKSYSLSLLFETSTILWNGLNAHQIQYNGVKKWFQYIKQV